MDHIYNIILKQIKRNNQQEESRIHCGKCEINQGAPQIKQQEYPNEQKIELKTPSSQAH